MIIEINQRFYMRTVKIEDAKDLYEFSKLSDVTKYLTWDAHQSIEQTIWVIKNIYFAKVKDGLPISFAIVDREFGKAIGIIDFVKFNDSDVVEIGYFLNPLYWGNGIMTKATNRILNFGFNTLEFDTIGISHMIDNIGSSRVIVKNGFRYVGTTKTMKNNNYYDVLYYEIRRDDFNNDKSR
ncbi:MAG: GNAT family protein [Acholeplasma sp.]|nr:GNAT family protein [Acholeplasma sp.]